MYFIIRWLVTAIACAAAIWIVPGLTVQTGITGIVILGLILALVDVALKPLLQILSIPITVLTLGIFYLVVNTILLYVAAWLSNGLFAVGVGIAGFGSAFLASIIISIVSALVNGIIGADSL